MRCVVPWLVVACRFEPNTAGADAASIDAAAVDGVDATSAAIPCADPIIDEPFADASPCEPWADDFATDSMLAQGSGALSISLASNGGGRAGGCFGRTVAPLAAGGAIVEVPGVIAGAGAYTQLQLLETDSVSLGVIDTELRYAHNSGTPVYRAAPYVAAEMRWWRLRPDPGAVAGILAEHSADGVTWTVFATHATTLETMRVQLIAGSNGGPAAGAARFTRLVMCP